LRYLNSLFDVEKHCNENKNPNGKKIPSDHSDLNEMGELKETVQEVLCKSKYNKVDLGGLFAFMLKA